MYLCRRKEENKFFDQLLGVQAPESLSKYTTINYNQEIYGLVSSMCSVKMNNSHKDIRHLATMNENFLLF